MTYKVSPSIKQEGMNTRGGEVETPNECESYFHRRRSTLRNFGIHVITFVTNMYLRTKN